MITFMEDVQFVSNLKLPWENLDNKTVLISGASGMIGSFMIHVLMNRDEKIKIYALGRNRETAYQRFKDYWEEENFCFIEQNINNPIIELGEVDYIIHAASNTHPIAYASDPIGTIATNIIGTQNLLEYSATHNTRRFLFASSVEVYGENRGDTEYFTEDYSGYINCNTLRAGYPESKRVGEAMCQAYIHQKNLDIVIARLSRTYGPTMLPSDSKAIAQFIKKGVTKENIILKSAGNQLYSYNYVADSVSGLLTILLKGKKGEAYNISDGDSDITLKMLAEIIADYSGTKVVFEVPDSLESMGYSKATKALLDSSRLRELSWSANWNIERGIHHTIDLLGETEHGK